MKNLFELIWGSAEENALNNASRVFNEYQAQISEVVACEARLEQQQKLADEAQAALQRTAGLYENAIKTMQPGDPEWLQLQISFKMRENASKTANEKLLDVKKELRQAQTVLIEKEKAHKTAQKIYDDLIAKKTDTVMSVPPAPTPPVSQTPPTPVRSVPGKISIPPAVAAHFEGKNDESMMTEAARRITKDSRKEREEAGKVKPGMDVAAFKKHLNDTLFSAAKTPINTPVISPSISTHEPNLLIEIEQRLVFNQDPEKSFAQSRNLFFSSVNPVTDEQATASPILTEAIKKRREKLGYT